jgi:hypothetical protein
VWKSAEWLPSPPTLVRIGLVVFVLAWIFGPYELQSAVPIWLPFLIALGLEPNFFVSALRPTRAPGRPDRSPQDADRDLFGYREDAEELLLVREGDEELWIPSSGESDEELDELIAVARERADDDVAAPLPAEPERVRYRPPLLRLATGLGLVVALAFVFWAVERNTGWNGLDASTRAEATARFSQEASRVAAKPVTIKCDESGEHVGAVQHADGVAVVGGQLAYLTPERCLELYRLAFKDEVKFNQTGRALAVLAHEAWHLRGVSDEGMTECYAFQSGVELGERLGLSQDTAQRMMRRQLAENALRSRGNPAYRVPADCRDGARLDLRPDVARFP